MSPDRAEDAEPAARLKWLQLGLLATAELLALGLWFSASAVVPQLSAEWFLTGSQQAWLTMSVQLGFVCGAVVSAVLNVADRWPLTRLVAGSTVLGAVANAAIPFLDAGPGLTIALRFVTGFALAGVYPPGMKLVATWTRRDRGLAIGLLVGALTVGSAVPHLLNAIPLLGPDGMPPWRGVLYAASVSALAGALVIGLFVRPGPHLGGAAPFDWRFAGRLLADRPVRLANFGYLGHMWELYAMWTWTPMFLIASYGRHGLSLTEARLAGFAAIAAGGLGCVMAGALADRYGRTLVAIWSMAISGACALCVGALYDEPRLLALLCAVWGFAVVADSAQFSAAVSELADPRYVGTALTLQTSLGFLLSMVTIQLIPPLALEVGWENVFPVLALGPAFGIWAMWRLRDLPEAAAMAGGRR
jgi:MFS family permease